MKSKARLLHFQTHAKALEKHAFLIIAHTMDITLSIPNQKSITLSQPN